jgi:hypothetical protein
VRLGLRAGDRRVAGMAGERDRYEQEQATHACQYASPRSLSGERGAQVLSRV